MLGWQFYSDRQVEDSFKSPWHGRRTQVPVISHHVYALFKMKKSFKKKSKCIKHVNFRYLNVYFNEHAVTLTFLKS